MKYTKGSQTSCATCKKGTVVTAVQSCFSGSQSLGVPLLEKCYFGIKFNNDAICDSVLSDEDKNSIEVDLCRIFAWCYKNERCPLTSITANFQAIKKKKPGSSVLRCGM